MSGSITIGTVLCCTLAGVDVRGYFLWSLLDNCEWAYGYSKRVRHRARGLRVAAPAVKDSARWYAEVIGRGGLERG
ncbi:beta-glucosidase [Streptomyces badius]